MNAFDKGVTVFLERFKRRFPESAFVWKESEVFGYRTYSCFSLNNVEIFEITTAAPQGRHVIAILSDATGLNVRIGKVGLRLPKFKQSACFWSAEILRRWNTKCTK